MTIDYRQSGQEDHQKERKANEKGGGKWLINMVRERREREEREKREKKARGASHPLIEDAEIDDFGDLCENAIGDQSTS